MAPDRRRRSEAQLWHWGRTLLSLLPLCTPVASRLAAARQQAPLQSAQLLPGPITLAPDAEQLGSGSPVSNCSALDVASATLDPMLYQAAVSAQAATVVVLLDLKDTQQQLSQATVVEAAGLVVQLERDTGGWVVP